jgi:hypothetical protein
MRIADEVSLPQEVSHFFDGKSLSGFDGCAAGHGVQHIIEQIAAGHFAIGLHQFFGEVANDSQESTAGNEHRAGVYEESGAAKVLDTESHFGEEVGGFEYCCRFDGGAFDCFGNQELLRFDRTSQNSLTQRFVHNSFVQSMLINDFNTGITGDDNIAVVNLECSKFVGYDGGFGDC